MDYLREIEGKRLHDRCITSPEMNMNMNMNMNTKSSSKYISCVPGPIIVGAGPSGLATAACLKEKGVPSLLLERSHCLASLWQLKTYNRLRLHLPKEFCELPMMSFPEEFPTYPTKQQFIDYLEAYARKFDISPVFNQTVVRAEYDQNLGFWRVRTTTTTTPSQQQRGIKNSNKEDMTTEYVCRWLIVATGENAEAVMPNIQGMESFLGPIMHTSFYKSGDDFKGKRVLVVGCGNSGMEVCLDLCNHNASPTLSVRDTVHVLPREMLGRSTFGLSMWLLKWLPMSLVDRLLLIVSRVILGDTARYGLGRPSIGPLELKNLSGKTPVLDVGTLAKIKKGDIKVCPGVQRLTRNNVEFVNGKTEKFDAIVFATGYKSNVPAWLQEKEMFSEKDGLPKRPFPNGWKGECGLYAVGFTKRGLLGASMDAKRIAEDIERCWKAEAKHLSSFITTTTRSSSPSS